MWCLPGFSYIRYGWYELKTKVQVLLTSYIMIATISICHNPLIPFSKAVNCWTKKKKGFISTPDELGELVAAAEVVNDEITNLWKDYLHKPDRKKGLALDHLLWMVVEMRDYGESVNFHSWECQECLCPQLWLDYIYLVSLSFLLRWNYVLYT